MLLVLIERDTIWVLQNKTNLMNSENLAGVAKLLFFGQVEN